MAENKQNSDCASFKDVQKSYLPGENLTVSYNLQPEYKGESCDWVGLFQVGWTSSRDYYTFEWTPTPVENKGTVTFAGRRLPPDDSNFYQFCYVSASGRVTGASPPFQFSSASICKYNVEDLELVEVSEDSLMVLQTRSSQGEVEKELTSFKESVTNLEGEKKELNEQLQQQGGQLKEKEDVIADLQRQMQAKRESEKRLMDKLDKQRADNHELMAAKSDEDNELAILTQQLASKDNDLTKQMRECETIRAECEDLKAQLHIKDSQVEDLTQLASARGEEKEQMSIELEHLREEFMEVKGQQADLLEQLDHKVLENEQYLTDLEEAKAEIQRWEERATGMQQELNIARENISELVGAGEGGLVIERPANQPSPPTAPAAPAGMVDQSVYEALLDAFTKLQKYYEELQKANQALHAKMQQEQIRADELFARVEQCRMEYEEVVRQNVDLKKQLRSGSGNQEHVKDLEQQTNELLQSCETAVAELTTRKEELKQRDSEVADLEDTLAQVQQELDNFQDRHDKDVHRRTEAMDIVKETLDKTVEKVSSLQHDNTKLSQVNDQLKGQLEGLKTAARSADRSCPVCNTKFPGRMKQQDFENHVQGHFKRQ